MGLRDFAALSFDCYGTLIDWESGILAALAPWLEGHRIDAAPGEVLAAFAEGESRHQTKAPATLYPEILSRALQDMGKRWGVPVSAEEAAAFGASVADWPAFADSSPALAYLKGHHKLVILSNIDKGSFAASNARLGVEFDAVLTAGEIGSYKPDRRNFQYMVDALAGMGIGKDRILHVAQSLFHDHVPAKEMGLTTMWIDRRHAAEGWGATMPPPTEVTPDYRCESMAAFADMVKGEGAS